MASNRKTRKLLILIYIWRFLHKVERASLLNTSLRHTLLKQIFISLLNSASRILFDIITVENAIKINYNLRYKEKRRKYSQHVFSLRSAICDWLSRFGVSLTIRLTSGTVMGNSFVLFDVSMEISQRQFSFGQVGYT